VKRDPDPPRTYVTNAPAAAGRAAPRRLTIVEGPDAPAEVLIPPGGLSVGTAADCGLRLSDRRVSRSHAHLLAQGVGFRVRDLGSSNGTLLDGVRITDAFVPAGSTIWVGRTALRLDGEEQPVALPASSRTSFGELRGRSVAMREVFAVLEQVVGGGASVLVEGETGTGKELVARALHTESPRARGPFIALDCGAIAANLVESELFGHVRGAFTGAVDARVGAFERAHGGTLFLDELGELPLELQPKLLRVLEAREVRRLGAADARKVDVRIVAGTNRDLSEMVDAGTFRADLYYRLKVVYVVLPQLRARLDDLPLLVEHLLAGAGATNVGPIEGPNLTRLLDHTWPGNVRELRNVLARGLALCGSAKVPFTELPLHVGGRRRATDPAPVGRRGPEIDLDTPFLEAKERLVEEFERAYLSALLTATEGNIAEAARRSRLNRRHLYDLLAKLGLRS
jgi:DNA-binding NtrC family response regulator